MSENEKNIKVHIDGKVLNATEFDARYPNPGLYNPNAPQIDRIEGKIGPVDEACAKQVRDDIDKKLAEAIYGWPEPMTCNVEMQVPEADTKRILEDLNKMARQMRREQVTFQVDVAHEGPMVGFETPCDGKIIECSWSQACEIRKRYPLKLKEVRSVTCADFAFTSNFDQFVPVDLPPPPWKVPNRD